MLPADGAQGDYRLGDGGDDVFAAGETFDVVVSVPPLGLPAVPFTVDGVDLRDNGGNEILLRSSLRLRPRGVGLYVVHPSFLLVSRPSSVAARLAEFGLYVDAAFLLPAGTFRPLTNIETYLVVVRRGEAPAKVFVADGSASNRHTVLANYQKRRAATEPELGALVVQQEFRGLAPLVMRRAAEQQTKRLRIPATRLGDLCVNIERCRRERSEIAEVDNAFFLRMAGPPQVAIDVDSLPSRLHDWALVHVAPERAEARVVAGFFDGPIGRLVVESHQAAGVVPRLPLSVLPELPVYLPGLAEQRSVIKLDQRLRSLSSEVAGLRTKLWRRLDKADEIASAVEQVNREDTLPAWLDTLPFPLASILWTYQTQKDQPLKRYYQLDFFFEGLGQFLAVLALSAVRRDEATFLKAWRSIKKTLDHGHLSLERATLGAWVIVFEGLAKVVRTDLDDADGAAHWQRLFACDDLDLLRGLVNKKLVSVLKQANRLRNGWRAHGGIVGDEEAARREREYSDLLLKFRDLVKNRWEGYPLVMPRTSRYSRGRHEVSVAHVVGTRTPFDGSTISTKEPLEDGQLHMAAPRLETVCPLLPLVRLGPSPQDKFNACYFYNRVEGEALKFVSYHFADKPEIIEPLAGAQEVLAELSAL